MAHFVLVHGAFDGAWCWAHLADELRAAGHTVLAPDLPAAGQDPTPLSEVTLASATQRVVDCLRSLDAPAVLVGHSMGGVVITQAAAEVPEKLVRSAIEKMGPQPLQLFETPVSLGDTILPPTEYVVCTRDRAVPPALQRLMAQRAPSCIHEVESGHSPFYAVPGEVWDILQHAAD